MNCVSDDATNEHQNARRAATRQPQQPRQRRDGARKRRRQTVEEAQGREQWWRAGLCWLVLAVRRADQHQRCGFMSLPQ